MQPQVDPVTVVLPSAAGLLAFVLAFYTLAARERKTPYLLESVYSACIWILIAAVLAMLSIALRPVPSILGYTDVSQRIGTVSAWFLIVAAIRVVLRIISVHNRHIHFRDDNMIGNIQFVRWVKSGLKRLRGKKTYEHHYIPVPSGLRKKIEEIFTKYGASAETTSLDPDNGPQSVVVVASSLSRVDEFLKELAVAFTEAECWTQYMPFSRHPFEFFNYLERQLSKDDLWNKLIGKIVIADAFTPHFGFADTTCEEKTALIKQHNIHVETNRSSYAGAHSASANAFNVIKAKRGKGGDRMTALVVYEGAHALVTVESIEQYRLFVQHVIPSERLWGGMLTVFIEVEPVSTSDIQLLRSHADRFIDMRLKEPKQDKTAPTSQ